MTGVVQELQQQIWFVEQADIEVEDELGLATNVAEDLEQLQQLHTDFTNWVLEYRSWKTSRRLPTPIYDAEDYWASEYFGDNYEPTVQQLSIVEPDNLAYDEPPPGYDTKLLDLD